MPDPTLPPVEVIDSRAVRAPLAIIDGAGQAYAVLWPGNGARYRTFNVIELSAGARTLDLCHAAECVYYVESGAGLIRDLGDNSSQELVEGAMIHIGISDSYRIEAGASGMRLLGGTVPVDPAFYDYLASGVAA